ncbi:MAG: radical SAM protein [Pseudomonadota bacterium]
MADSLVNGNFKVLEKLVDLINDYKHPLTWHGYARIDRRMTTTLLQKIGRSGCQFLSYGLETGSQKVMDLMEKRTTVEEARRVIRETFLSGVRVHLNMIVGFPGEDEKDFQDTIEFLEEMSPYIHTVNTGETCGIPMHTPLWDEPERFGIKTLEDGSIDWSSGSWESADGTSNETTRRGRLNSLRDFLDTKDHIVWFPRGPRPNQIYREPPSPLLNSVTL